MRESKTRRLRSLGGYPWHLVVRPLDELFLWSPLTRGPSSIRREEEKMRRTTLSAAALVFVVALAGAGVGAPAAAAEPTCFGEAATIVGTPDADVLAGTSGPDVIVGLGGDDVMQGRGGNDVMCGGAGADGLVGSTGDDALSGDLGDDVLNGGSGDDRLLGLLGTDTCLQGPGTGAERGCERLTSNLRSRSGRPSTTRGSRRRGADRALHELQPVPRPLRLGTLAIRAHLRAMEYGGIEVGISSWWGRGEPTDERVP
jgi:hypothetical protein